ncbi:MAG: hypothetical protein Ct9H90mV1_1460 [Prasinovirus sp.]|nr:MAG: hypothetical protein Ct9H90mV1_1460 [Prasinovirus sp.]
MGATLPEQHHWCPKQEKLLIGWAEKAAGYRWLHNHARMFYKKQNDWLSYPCIIISSITGVGGFAVLSPNDESMSDAKKTTDNSNSILFCVFKRTCGHTYICFQV